MTLQPTSGKKGGKKAAAAAQKAKGQVQLTNFFKSPVANTPQRNTPSQTPGSSSVGASSSTSSPSEEPQGPALVMEHDDKDIDMKDVAEEDGAEASSSSPQLPSNTKTATASTAVASRPTSRGKPVSKKRGRGKNQEDKENTSNSAEEASSTSPVKPDGVVAPSAPERVQKDDDNEEAGEGDVDGETGMQCDHDMDTTAPVAMEVVENDDVVEVEKVVPPPQGDGSEAAAPMAEADITTTDTAPATTEGPDDASTAASAAAKKTKSKAKGGGGGKASKAKKAAAVPAGPPSALEVKYQAQLDELLGKWHESQEEEEADHYLGVKEVMEEMTSAPTSTTAAEAPTEETNAESKGPDLLSQLLARLVQGSRLPLVSLSQNVLQYMSEALLPCVESLTEEAIQDKIRQVAERKYYGVQPKDPPRWEDTTDLSMLVWEASDHLLPSDNAAVVKELRADRNVLGKHIKALHNLIQVIRKNPSDSTKIAPMEEKVFKLDRDADAARQKKLKRAKLKEEKEAAAAEKAEKARLKEEEKQRKEEEKQMKKEEAQRKKEETEKRKREEAAESGDGSNKKARASTDGASAKKKAPPTPPPGQSLFKFFKVQEPKNQQDSGAEGGVVDSSTSGSPMQVEKKGREDDIDQAIRAGQSWDEMMRRRREESKKDEDVVVMTRKPHKFVSVPVAISRNREGSMWDGPDYAELVDVKLWNRMKMLQFHEDYRPAYYGTWSKRSKVVTGRRFLAKDRRLDYDYDSEEDWEEEDADQGESLSVTADDDDQDPDDGLDYEDGWLRRDDDFGLSDGEDGPDGALGMADTDKDNGMNRVGPFFFNADFECDTPLPPQPGEAERVKSTLEMYRVVVLDMSLLQMEGLDETETKNDQTAAASGGGDAAASTDTPSSANKGNNRSKPVGDEDMPALVRIVHLSTSGKEKLVEEFLKDHPGPSKAKIREKIDEIASKQRRIKGGPIWMVKDDILIKCGITPPVPEPEPEGEAEQPSSAEKGSKKKDRPKKDKEAAKEKEKEKEKEESEVMKGQKTLNNFFQKPAALDSTSTSDDVAASKDNKSSFEDVVMMVVDHEEPPSGDASSADLQTPPPVAMVVQRRFRGSDDQGWEEAKVSSK